MENNKLTQDIILQQSIMGYNGTSTLNHDDQILKEIRDNQLVSYMTDAISVVISILLALEINRFFRANKK